MDLLCIFIYKMFEAYTESYCMARDYASVADEVVESVVANTIST